MRENQLPKRIVSIEELAEYLGMPKGTLYHWVSQRRIPFVKLGRSTRFDIQQINQWLAQRSYEPQQEVNSGHL